VAGLLKPKLHRSGRLDNPNPTATEDERKDFPAADFCGPITADILVLKPGDLILSTLIFNRSLFTPAQASAPDSQMVRGARMQGHACCVAIRPSHFFRGRPIPGSRRQAASVVQPLTGSSMTT
jgi:hypothetical protein